MRMQHYAIFLRGFNFEIRYKRSEQNSNADCFSRLPLEEFNNHYDVVDLYYIDACQSTFLIYIIRHRKIQF